MILQSFYAKQYFCDTISILHPLLYKHFSPLSLHMQVKSMVFQVNCIGSNTTWFNEMNFGLNHTAGAGSIARPVDMQSSAMTTVVRLTPTTVTVSTYRHISRSTCPLPSLSFGWVCIQARWRSCPPGWGIEKRNV